MTGFAVSIQTAVFNALDGSAELTALLANHEEFSRSGIYGFVPASAQSGNNSLFPLLTIGEDSPNDWSTDTASGTEASVMVHVWSRSPGWSECKKVADAVRDTLHRAELVTPDKAFIGMEWESDEYVRDPDGITLHCAMQFRMIVDQEDFGE